MRKLIVVSLTALASAPVVGLAALQATAPVFADTPGVSPTCFPQSANPHPTAPAAQTTDTLFCTPGNPSGSGSGGSGSSGSGSSGSGSSGSGSANAGTGAGSGQTSLASGWGTSGSTPDESMRSNWASTGNGSKSTAAKPANAKGPGIFAGLVSFFSTAGGILALFGLLLLLLLILAAIAVMGWLRPAQGKNWSSRFARLTFRA
jgi:hypothetical protein